MASRGLHLSVLTLLGGCYFDISAGAARTAGGVSGYGWEIGMAGGVAWDIGKIVRPGIGVDASMSRTSGDDGKFGHQGFTYHGRIDLALGAPEAKKAEDMYATQGAMVNGNLSDLEGITGQTRLVLDYGRSRKEELRFTSSMADAMQYTRDATVHSLYLGIAREYNWQGSVTISYSIGPHVTMMPNDFVGDSTAIGLAVHNSFWFIPVFRPKKSGSLLEHYTPSDPIKPLPTAPDPVQCHDRFGSRVPC